MSGHGEKMIQMPEEPAPAPALNTATITCYEYDPLGGYSVKDRSVYISSIDGRPFKDGSHLAALGEAGTGIDCNASGYWEADVPLGLTLIFKIVDNVSKRFEYYKVKIPSVAGTYTFGSLQPQRVQLSG
jgi:hypothetical protein